MASCHLEQYQLTLTLLLVRLVVGSDQTEILRAGYWPSYNVPFHEKVGKNDSCLRLWYQKPCGA